MHELGFAVLAILGYPFLVAWLVGLSKASRIAELEQQLAALNERVHRLTTPPSPVAPTWQPTTVVPVATPQPHIAKANLPEPIQDNHSASPPPQPQTTTLAPEPVVSVSTKAASTVREEPVPDPYLEPPPRWLIAAKTWLSPATWSPSLVS